MYRHHLYCRACGYGRPPLETLKYSTPAGPIKPTEGLIDILDLGPMPMANDFSDMGGDHRGYAPLKLKWCPKCTLAQLSVVVDPEILYRNYPYVTSHSTTMMAHFELLLEDLLKECKRGTVVEIGSNDGTLLDYCSKVGFETVFGIEPASNLCDLALKRGINTDNNFWNSTTAINLRASMGPPDLIIARHVFCHIDRWDDAIAGLETICGQETVIAIEVPYFIETVKKCEWDQIYHEHLSYMTVEAMRAALRNTSLHISKVTHYSIHGGAVVMMIRSNDSKVKPCSFEDETLSLEDLRAFANKSDSQVSDLSDMVRKLSEDGKTVVGYGASAKATQWIHRCGFTRKQIKWVCDNTPQKLYKLMPGTDIPVVDDGALTRDLPDYAVLFSWNFADEIIGKEQIFRNKGGCWIVPLPEMKVI